MWQSIRIDERCKKMALRGKRKRKKANRGAMSGARNTNEGKRGSGRGVTNTKTKRENTQNRKPKKNPITPGGAAALITTKERAKNSVSTMAHRKAFLTTPPCVPNPNTRACAWARVRYTKRERKEKRKQEEREKRREKEKKRRKKKGHKKERRNIKEEREKKRVRRTKENRKQREVGHINARVRYPPTPPKS